MFIVYIKLYNNNNLEIENTSNYSCRIHFKGDEETHSLLCYGKTRRNYILKYKSIIFSKGLLVKNKKMRLPLQDLQFYFDDKEDYNDFLDFRSTYNEDNDKILIKTNEKNLITQKEENENKLKIENKIKNDLNLQNNNKNLNKNNDKTKPILWSDVAEEEEIKSKIKNEEDKNNQKLENLEIKQKINKNLETNIIKNIGLKEEDDKDCESDTSYKSNADNDIEYTLIEYEMKLLKIKQELLNYGIKLKYEFIDNNKKS